MDVIKTGILKDKVWRQERLKNQVRFAYGDSLSEENRIAGEIPVYGSNGVVGTHEKAITIGETIIIGRKGSFGKVQWSDGPCFPIDTTYFVDKTQTQVFLRWLYYALGDIDLDKVNFDSAVPGLSRQVAYSLRLSFPPIYEQKVIAKYLDGQCASIDKVIEIKEEQLEILENLRKSIIHKAVTKGLDDSVKFKSSGISWIGEIPKTWGIERLKDVIPRIYGGATPDSSEPDYWLNGDIVWITPSDYQAFSDERYIGNSERKITQLGLDSCATQLLPIGTVLMTSRASIGEARISKCQLCTNQGFISFICDNFSNRFLAYVIDAYLGDYFSAVAPGTTFKEIGRTAVKNEYIAFPDINTQESISDYLDSRCKELKQLRTNLNSQVETLFDYRKSLVHECVTGKRRITEDDLRELGNV